MTLANRSTITEMALKEIPDRYLGMIIHFMMSFHNETAEFKRPLIRTSFYSIYPFYLLLYGIVFISGILSNGLMLYQIISYRKQCQSIHKYLASNAINDIVKCIGVLPVALSTILFQNWVYGSFFCYFFPMFQDVPFHATVQTFLLISFDRYRQIMNPLKPRIPPYLCLLGVWIASCFAVLPYAVYTKYLDLEVYLGSQFKGSGICAVNVEDNIEEYIRGLFIVLYVLPLGLIAYLHVKVSEEIKTRQSSVSAVYHDTPGASSTREDASISSLTPCVMANSRKQSSVALSLYSEDTSTRISHGGRSSQEIALRLTSENREVDEEPDWARERRTQTFLMTAIVSYAICLLPLNLIRLLKHVVYETYDSSYHFDHAFICVVWLAFIPSVLTPLLFRSWHLSCIRGEELARYLRLGRASAISASVSNGCRTSTFDPPYTDGPHFG